MKPRRIVCLTAETTEIAFAVGAGERVVGVSGYALRPPEARKRPKVAAFRTAHVERILALEPDLVLGFSDLQAEIARELISAGVNVLVTNQRTLGETAAAIALVGAACGEPEAGRALAEEFVRELEELRQRPGRPRRRVRVYFEEWDDPLISGIAWVSELIELCGGEDVFPELRGCRSARERIVEGPEVVRRDPEVIVASWCGKRARLERIAERPGWREVRAVREGRLHEIKSPDILAPGPSLLRGARQLAAVLDAAATGEG
ncbi:MAG: cobalamin-binding protein [Tepidiforma sp.]|nr:MAG: cobalamin-binding protein [Tepidiforma sp.]